MTKLKILITNSKSGAFFYIANGWINALKLCGHDARLWDGDEHTWNNVKPDIYIGCSGWRQKFKHHIGTKVAIHVNPYCDEIIQVPGGPVINESQDAINWTLAQKPDVVFGYGLQLHMDRYWHKWRKHCNTIAMPNAADTTKYYPVPKDMPHAVDIGWVGGYWQYKAMNLDKYVVPVARKFKTKWYGWSGPQGLWSGKVENEEIVRKLFCSAKICPTVVEPHTTIYGIDVPERIFKVAACGGLVVSDPFRDYDQFFNKDTILMANTHAEYMSICTNWIAKSNEERFAQAQRFRIDVLSKHTYLHRIQTLLMGLGFKSAATDVQIEIDKLL